MLKMEREPFFYGEENEKSQENIFDDIYKSKEIEGAEEREEIPKTFYHGTSSSNLAEIFERGLVGGINLTEERKKDNGKKQ